MEKKFSLRRISKVAFPFKLVTGNFRLIQNGMFLSGVSGKSPLSPLVHVYISKQRMDEEFVPRLFQSPSSRIYPGDGF